jgi:hypothetical protein
MPGAAPALGNVPRRVEDLPSPGASTRARRDPDDLPAGGAARSTPFLSSSEATERSRGRLRHAAPEEPRTVADNMERFELSSDPQGHYWFTLKNADGTALLFGLKIDGRVAAGIDVLHVRRAVRDVRHFVPHAAPDGAFVVLKDSSGEVLAKSPRVPRSRLRTLVLAIQEAAPIAGIQENSPAPAPSSSH